MTATSTATLADVPLPSLPLVRLCVMRWIEVMSASLATYLHTFLLTNLSCVSRHTFPFTNYTHTNFLWPSRQAHLDTLMRLHPKHTNDFASPLAKSCWQICPLKFPPTRKEKESAPLAAKQLHSDLLFLCLTHFYFFLISFIFFFIGFFYLTVVQAVLCTSGTP